MTRQKKARKRRAFGTQFNAVCEPKSWVLSGRCRGALEAEKNSLENQNTALLCFSFSWQCSRRRGREGVECVAFCRGGNCVCPSDWTLNPIQRINNFPDLFPNGCLVKHTLSLGITNVSKNWQFQLVEIYYIPKQIVSLSLSQFWASFIGRRCQWHYSRRRRSFFWDGLLSYVRVRLS